MGVVGDVTVQVSKLDAFTIRTRYAPDVPGGGSGDP